MRPSNWSRSIALICALAGGCDGEECPTLNPCDIRGAGCQDQVMRWLSCERGGDAALPVVQVVSEADLLLRAEDGQAMLSEEDLADVAAWNAGLAQFALAPSAYDLAEQTRAQVGMFAAVYSSDDRVVLVVDRGQPMNTPEAVGLLAHELVHALQDPELEQRGFWAQAMTFDHALARRALTEGEAVHYEGLAMLAQDGVSPYTVDWELFYSEWRASTLRKAELDPWPFAMANLYFPYAFGGGWVTQHWLAGGRAAIDALFEAPPHTTREVLFGAPPYDVDAAVESVRERGLPVLSEDFERRGAATLGAWVARMYTARIAVPPELRWQHARELAADVLTVHTDHVTGQTLATWHLSMVPGALPGSWPAPGRLEYVSGWIPESANDIYLVSTAPGVPPRPETLRWTMVDEDVAMPVSMASGRGVVACSIAAPSLREFQRPGNAAW